MDPSRSARPQLQASTCEICVGRHVRTERRKYGGVGLHGEDAALSAHPICRNQREVSDMGADVEERSACVEQCPGPTSHRIRKTAHVDLAMNDVLEVQRHGV